MLYGAIEETTQPLVNRVASLIDWLADAIGATLGLAVFGRGPTVGWTNWFRATRCRSMLSSQSLAPLLVKDALRCDDARRAGLLLDDAADDECAAVCASHSACATMRRRRVFSLPSQDTFPGSFKNVRCFRSRPEHSAAYLERFVERRTAHRRLQSATATDDGDDHESSLTILSIDAAWHARLVLIASRRSV